MGLKVLQINLNHTWVAQNHLAQVVLERNCGICAVSEPAGVVDTSPWFFSDNSLAAIYIGPSFRGAFSLYKRGFDFVAVRKGDLFFFSFYISPNTDFQAFQEALDSLSNALLTCINGHVILCGDFNAHSHLWGGHFVDDRGTFM